MRKLADTIIPSLEIISLWNRVGEPVSFLEATRNILDYSSPTTRQDLMDQQLVHYQQD